MTDLPTRTWILLQGTEGRPAAEVAAELAAQLPQGSSLQVRYGSRPDPVAAAKHGYLIACEVPDGTATYWLNEQAISKELFEELDAINQARREQECAEHGHAVPTPRCTRCGHRP